MNRKEIGAYINKHGLGQKVKDTFGDNWTRVATEKLEALVNEHMGFGKGKAVEEPAKPAKPAKAAAKKPAEKKPAAKKEPAKKEPAIATQPEATGTQGAASQPTSTDNPLEAACLVFLGLLKDAGLLDELLGKL